MSTGLACKVHPPLLVSLHDACIGHFLRASGGIARIEDLHFGSQPNLPELIHGVPRSDRLFSMFQRHHEPPLGWFPKSRHRQNFQRDLVGVGLAATGWGVSGVLASTIWI